MGCNPLLPALVKAQRVRPDALPAGFSSEILFVFRSSSSKPPEPTTAGLRLFDAKGSQVADISCHMGIAPAKYELGPVKVAICPTPALVVGSFQMQLSADPTCGALSYKKLDDVMDVIEPPHLSGLTPAHGPQKKKTTVTISGTNIGGPHVSCEFRFPPAPGAKSGCSMTVSTGPAEKSTSSSVTCTVPEWPGPLTQYDGKGGFVPVPGAVCSKEVDVTVTNDARVNSQES